MVGIIFRYYDEHLYLNKCSDRSMNMKLPALGSYDTPNDGGPTNPSNRPIINNESYLPFVYRISEHLYNQSLAYFLTNICCIFLLCKSFWPWFQFQQAVPAQEEISDSHVQQKLGHLPERRHNLPTLQVTEVGITCLLFRYRQIIQAKVMVTDGPNLSTLQDTETASLAYFSGKSEMGSACRDGHQMPTLKVTVMGTNCQFFR